MVLDHIIFATALGGSIAASAYDLKTTEVPNWVFYAMMAVGIPAVILRFVFSGDFDSFALSGMTGVGLFGFGYLMYKIGQWGGADMVLLALVGFMVPSVSLGLPGELSFPFGISFLFNVFMIGAGYMLVYAVVFSLINGKMFPMFKQEIKRSWKFILVVVLSAAAAFTAIMFYVDSLLGSSLSAASISQNVLISTGIVAGFMLVYKFARLIEDVGFKRRVSVARLKVGDMLMSERKLVGISRDQINRLKRSGTRSVWIKDGVRFIPVFPIALLFTLYYGDIIFLIRSLF